MTNRILKKKSKSYWMKLCSEFCCAAMPVYQAPDKIKTKITTQHTSGNVMSYNIRCKDFLLKKNRAKTPTKVINFVQKSAVSMVSRPQRSVGYCCKCISQV